MEKGGTSGEDVVVEENLILGVRVYHHGGGIGDHRHSEIELDSPIPSEATVVVS